MVAINDTYQLASGTLDPRIVARAKEALLARYVTNARAVAENMVEAADTLWTVAHEQGHRTEWVNRHPILRLYAERLIDLTHSSEISTFSGACGWVQTLLLKAEKAR